MRISTCHKYKRILFKGFYVFCELSLPMNCVSSPPSSSRKILLILHKLSFMKYFQNKVIPRYPWVWIILKESISKPPIPRSRLSSNYFLENTLILSHQYSCPFSFTSVLLHFANLTMTPCLGLKNLQSTYQLESTLLEGESCKSKPRNVEGGD